jgi:tRNA1Val (adenine37-N6)-methyltransferase
MFQFQRFTIHQDQCAMKVGTDGVLLGAWAQGGERVLDIGTGTGVIALMMAQRYAEAHVVAVDIDEAAVRQARQNADASPFGDRVEVVLSSIQDYATSCSLSFGEGRGEVPAHFDSIVCNPPFFVDSLKAPDQQRSLARHADTLPFAELMRSAYRLLSDDGELSLVIPFDYRRRLDDEAFLCGFFPSRVCAVRTKSTKPVRRYLLAYRKRPCPCHHDELTIGDARYQQLTRDFYLCLS